MGPKKPLTGTTGNSSSSAEDKMLASDVQIHIEVALVKKDVENLQKDLSDIKSKMVEKDDLTKVEEKVNKIESNSTWAVRLLVGAVLVQIMSWLLKGGLNIPLPR